jgi:hypothetical protein
MPLWSFAIGGNVSAAGWPFATKHFRYRDDPRAGETARPETAPDRYIRSALSAKTGGRS